GLGVARYVGESLVLRYPEGCARTFGPVDVGGASWSTVHRSFRGRSYLHVLHGGVSAWAGNGQLRRQQRRCRRIECCASRCRHVTADIADDTAACMRSECPTRTLPPHRGIPSRLMSLMGHLRPSNRTYVALHVRFAPIADKYNSETVRRMSA